MVSEALLWQFLEEHPKQNASWCEWQDAFRGWDSFTGFERKFLQLTNQRAFAVNCRTDCGLGYPRKVVEHAADDIAAVCPEQEEKPYSLKALRPTTDVFTTFQADVPEPDSDGMVHFDTPAGINWSGISIKFIDGHTVSIRTTKSNGQKTINFYSFATKYCSHHFPDDYPIYDSFVEKMLMHFKRVDKFFKFKKDDLKLYPTYHAVLMEFSRFYGLEDFTLEQIDKYLWQAGKDYFPKQY